MSILQCWIGEWTFGGRLRVTSEWCSCGMVEPPTLMGSNRHCHGSPRLWLRYSGVTKARHLVVHFPRQASLILSCRDDTDENSLAMNPARTATSKNTENRVVQYLFREALVASACVVIIPDDYSGITKSSSRIYSWIL